MRHLTTLIAAAALAVGAAPVSAQTYAPLAPVQINPNAVAATMMDDGSSSDYPVHMPGDQSGDALNAQYQGGIPTTPGHGFPAYPTYPAYPR